MDINSSCVSSENYSNFQHSYYRSELVGQTSNALNHLRMEQDHSVKGIVWSPLTEDSECRSRAGGCFALGKQLHVSLLPQSCLNSLEFLYQFFKNKQTRQKNLKNQPPNTNQTKAPNQTKPPNSALYGHHRSSEEDELSVKLPFICGTENGSVEFLNWIPESCI